MLIRNFSLAVFVRVWWEMLGLQTANAAPPPLNRALILMKIICHAGHFNVKIMCRACRFNRGSRLVIEMASEMDVFSWLFQTKSLLGISEQSAYLAADPLLDVGSFGGMTPHQCNLHFGIDKFKLGALLTSNITEPGRKSRV